MNAYIQSVIDTVKRRDNAKPEYIQCVEEVFSSLSPVIEQTRSMWRTIFLPVWWSRID